MEKTARTTKKNKVAADKVLTKSVKTLKGVAQVIDIKPEKTEITALFAGASILVMLIGGILSLLWFSRMP